MFLYSFFFFAEINRVPSGEWIVKAWEALLVTNTNEIGLPMQRVMEDIRSHYELAYSPTSTTYDGHFRKIDVKISRPKVTLQTRKGYYAVPDLNGEPLQPYELLALNAMNAQVSDGTRTISIPIHWNFGAGAQTWVLERDGHRYESAVSYYPSIPGLDFTTGDDDLKPRNLEEAIGREIGMAETKVCFGCHASNAVTNGKMTFETLRPGVTCEHCHAGTTTHLTDSFNGDFDSTPPDFRKWPSEDTSNFCGQCHRSWETVVRNHWRGQLTVRFQPYRLANSKCFDGADPRISCIRSGTILRRAAWETPSEV